MHGTSEFHLEAIETDVPFGGGTTRRLTYGGTLPGPTLRFEEGQRVRIHFTNRLGEATNLHLHGIPMPPEVDAPHRVVEPGESAIYEFTLPAGSAGTYWYHPHLHGQVARQLGAGLAGAIVVTGPIDRAALGHASEEVLVLQDSGLANGEVARVRAPAGLVRLRIVNASTARTWALQLEGAEAFLAGLDGGFLEAPVPIPGVALAPGERADLLVPASRAGEIRLVGGDAVLARIAVQGEATVELPERLAEVERLDEKTAVATRRVVWGGALDPLRFHVNGRPFDPRRIDFEAGLGTLEIWEVENPMRMDHPFHLHIHAFQVLDRNGVPEPFRAWRDTVNVRPGEKVRIAVPFRSFPGVTMFHCHVAEHEDRGMMAHLAVR